jgi:transketolase
MRASFIDRLMQMAENDEKIILVTGDLGFGVLDEYIKRFPRQYINAGVTEQSMMSLSAGLASMGYRVFVYSIGNFPTLRCLEQIRNDVCLMNNSVVIVSVGAGYSYGAQGYSHHALEDISIMRTLPNLEVLSPCNTFETKELTTLLCNSSGPAYLRLGLAKENLEGFISPNVDLGKFRLMKAGDDGAIIFTGAIGELAVQAAKKLSQLGVELALYSAPFISTVDLNTLQAIAKKGLVITLEEQAGEGGFGSSILEKLSDLNIQCKTKRIYASRLDLLESGSQKYLQEFNGLSADRIVSEIMELLNQETRSIGKA